MNHKGWAPHPTSLTRFELANRTTSYGVEPPPFNNHLMFQILQQYFRPVNFYFAFYETLLYYVVNAETNGGMG